MNFKHLHYFWAAAKAGGIVRAGEQLHISPQTLSGQIKLLEDRLGCALFRKSGRGLELTEGRLALGPNQIFALGAELKARVGKAARSSEHALTFTSASPIRCPRPWPTVCWSRRWRSRNTYA
jgi:LysR family transcriptional activator of nhaA